MREAILRRQSTALSFNLARMSPAHPRSRREDAAACATISFCSAPQTLAEKADCYEYFDGVSGEEK